ncbi:MAG: hypothetical protein HC853_02705 [Anaerolineae bacterium]|nr:hypothetical protein [Anaerolineae bacterium]
MGQAFRVIVKTFKDIWGEMFLLVLMNLLTLVCLAALPFLALTLLQVLGFEFSLPTLLVVLALSALSPLGPAAMLALYHVTNRIANDFAISWDIYWDAFKKHFKKAWVFGIFSQFVTFAIPVNAIWYPQMFGNQMWVSWVQGAWLALGLFWLAISFYVMAFFAEQETKRWRTALRNSALIAAANPIFTLVLLLFVGLIMGLSLLLTPVFILLGLAVWAMFGSEAVVNRVNAFRERMKAESSQTSAPEHRPEGA